MIEENKEVVEETTEENVEQPIEEVVDEVDLSKFDSAEDPDVIKIDLDKAPEVKSEEVEQQPAEEDNVDVVDEKPEAVEEQVEKLINFMEETGGDINDYVNLNREVDKMDDSDILDEYYRSTKSHLSPEERSFLLEDSFGYDEDVDDAKEIRKKKIALKEQVAEAKAHLDRQKSKYYEEIKAGSKLTQEQQEAIEFFNRYNKESEKQKKLTQKTHETFLKKTNSVFNKNFKGFDYEVGDKKFRFNVKDVEKVKTTQSDLNNFVNKFVGEGTDIEDAAGYHKSLFTAMNADAIDKHFYEQGKADAIKNQVAKDKNIDMSPRQSHGEVSAGGIKVRVLGESADDFKFKIKSKNKK